MNMNVGINMKFKKVCCKIDEDTYIQIREYMGETQTLQGWLNRAILEKLDALDQGDEGILNWPPDKPIKVSPS